MHRFSQFHLPRFRLRHAVWLGCTAAVILLLWVVPRWLDQSRWLSWSEQRASAAIGQPVHIGKITFHLLPRPGFDAEQITIVNPAWASQPLLAKIDRLSVQFNVASLLQRRPQVTALQATGVQLDLEQDAARHANWQPTANADRIDSAAPGHFDALTSLDVQQMSVRYATAQRDFGSWQIEQLHLDAQPLGRQLQISAAIIHQQQRMTIRGSADSLAALSLGQLSIETGVGSVVIDAHRLPLAKPGTGTFAVQVDARRLDQLLAFFQVASRPIAPLQVNADVHLDGKQFSLTQIAAKLGELRVGGSAQLSTDQTVPLVRAQLVVPRLDWVRTLADAGRPPVAPPPVGEVFRTHRLPWRLLAAVHGLRAEVDLKIGTLKTRSGIELTDASAQMLINDGQLRATSMQAHLLGGTASGTMQLIGSDQAAQLNVQLHDVSLQKGLQAMGKSAPVFGGPLQLRAAVHARGESIKALAASMTGPVTVTLGPTRIASPAGARGEELLTGLLPYFSARDVQEIRLECGSAQLPFQNGRASASPLVGMRSQASQLLTQGDIDLREQSLDLRGRVRSRSGFSLGLSALSGDIRISGPLTKLHAKLDPAGSPAAAARIGAAIVTGGLSLVGTALWDSAHPGADPCVAALAKSTAVATTRPASSAHASQSSSAVPASRGAKAVP